MRLNFLFLVLFFSFFAFVFWANKSFAEEATKPSLEKKFDFTSSTSPGILFFGLEASQLHSSLSNTVCYGPRIGVDYDLGSKLSVSPSLALGLNGSQLIYSGLSAYLRYSITGDSISKKQKLLMNGVSVFEERSEKLNRFSVGLGLEQLFLNGSQSVYPSVGFSVATAYSFEAFNRPLEASVRYSSMTANRQPMTGLFFDISILIGL